MKIIKCDICKKEITDGSTTYISASVPVTGARLEDEYIDAPPKSHGFIDIELCSECSQKVIKAFEDLEREAKA